MEYYKHTGFIHLLESIIVGMHYTGGRNREYLDDPKHWPKHLLQLRIEFEIRQASINKKHLFEWLGTQSR